MNSILPIAERHERLLRTVGTNGPNDLSLELEIAAVNLWNGASIAMKTEAVETRKVLCSVKLFGCMLCSVQDLIEPSLKGKFRSLNCLNRTLRSCVDEQERSIAEKTQEHADRVFKSLESISTGFEKEVFEEFQKVKTELFITKMQLSIVEGDVEMAKFYEERAEAFTTMVNQALALETSRVIYNSSLVLANRGLHADTAHFLKKALSVVSYFDLSSESTYVKKSICGLLVRSCLEIKTEESLQTAAETIQTMECLVTGQDTVEPYGLAIELAKIRGTTVDIESIIMRMIMSVSISENFKAILGLINDYAATDPYSAIKCYEYAFTNKLDPEKDHDGLEMLFVAMVNAYIKDKATAVEYKRKGLTLFFESAEKLFLRPLSKKCSSSSITLLWTAGKSCMKSNEFQDSVIWLSLGLHRVLQINDVDKGKFQRALQNAYLNLDEHTKTIDIYTTMSPESKDSLIAQYNMFKLYNALKDEEKMLGCLKKLVGYDEKNVIPLLSLCAINCESSSRVAIESMMLLFSKISGGWESEISIASTIKSVIELILKEMNQSFKGQYCETLLTMFQEAQKFAQSNPTTFSIDELKWFGAQSFNVARTCLIEGDYFYGDMIADCCARLVNLIKDDISLAESMSLKLWRFRAGLISVMCQSKIPNIDPKVLWSNVRTKSLNLRIMIDELMITCQQNPELQSLQSEWEKCILDCMLFQFQSELELGNQSALESIIKESYHCRTIEFDSTVVNVVNDTKYPARLRSLVFSSIIERNISDSKVPSSTISRWIRLLLKQNEIDASMQKVLTQVIARLGSQSEDNKFPVHEVEWMSTQCWNRGVSLFFNGDRSQGAIWCTNAMRLSKFVNERLETTLISMWNEVSTTTTT
ncbi:Sporulation-specific protein 22 [Cyberlindnera fabianii]|nr:Sporulation-specific protein 22 [Cyberlindnera fabianii]